jgi:hypothetical protein
MVVDVSMRRSITAACQAILLTLMFGAVSGEMSAFGSDGSEKDPFYMKVDKPERTGLYTDIGVHCGIPTGRFAKFNTRSGVGGGVLIAYPDRTAGLSFGVSIVALLEFGDFTYLVPISDAEDEGRFKTSISESIVQAHLTVRYQTAVGPLVAFGEGLIGVTRSSVSLEIFDVHEGTDAAPSEAPVTESEGDAGLSGGFGCGLKVGLWGLDLEETSKRTSGGIVAGLRYTGSAELSQLDTRSIYKHDQVFEYSMYDSPVTLLSVFLGVYISF